MKKQKNKQTNNEIMHFGIRVLEGKYGFKLIKKNYAIINKNSSSKRFYKNCIEWKGETNEMIENARKEAHNRFENFVDWRLKDSWCKKQRRSALKNYDLNMNFFKRLKKSEFNKEINCFISKYKKFKEIKDLNTCKNKIGYYIMVFDEYKQVYIGTTDSTGILDRIRQHWNGTKDFERLLYPDGAVDKSKISIDAFRPLDTTRIFVYATSNTFDKEDEFINCFSDKFILNRESGGKKYTILDANPKTRKLT